MPEKVGGALHDEQTEAQAVQSGRIDPVKSAEDERQILGGDAGACIVYFDAQFRAAPAAADEHPTAPRRIGNGIAHQVAQDAVQQNGMAQDGGRGPDDAKPDPVPLRRLPALGRERGQNRIEGYGLASADVQAPSALQRVDEIIQHAGQLGRRSLCASEYGLV